MPLTRRQTVLVKSEGANYGVDPGHAATDAQLLHDVTIRANNAPGYARRVMSSRLDRARINVLGKRSVGISFSQELRGNAADLAAAVTPMFHDLLTACGFAPAWNAGPANWTYEQSMPDPTSVAIEVNADGLQRQILGCRGTAVMRFVPGERVMVDYDFLGRYSVPTEVAIAAPDYADDVVPVICQSTGFVPYGWAPTAAQFGHVRSLTLDLRRNVIFRESLTIGSEGLGVVSLLGAGSEDDPGVGFSMEVEQQATADAADFWWSRYNGQTLSVPCGLTHGAVAGNTITVSLARLQLLDIEDIDISGRWDHRITGRVLCSAGAIADDAVYITAT